MKTASFQPSLEPTPPGTAEDEYNDTSSLAALSSLRQSPPPVTGDAQIPVGAVISPPDSASNSSDDEETKDERGRQLENLAELQAAIRVIEQHRESSPNRTAVEVSKANRALALIMPTEPKTEDKPTTVYVEKSTVDTLRKIAHNRSNTDSSIYVNIQHTPERSLSPSDEESVSDEDEPERSRRKPQMLRKKSGELVRPALRPSSARRRPSSMPGTPTFSKAVHFDSHLEHVRHFLQVDRPLAVSAGSSPVEAYESDNEFPFGEDNSRGPPFEWEIVVSNFPADSPIRLAMPVRVERVFLSSDNKTLVGSVAVANLAFHKHVVARFTLDYWKTTSEVIAEFNHDIRQPKREGYDRFNFNIKLADQANLEAKTMFFCVKYTVNGKEYWDNNNSTNYQVDFKKKAKPQNGKKGMQGAASRPVNSLPRSNKKSPTERPKSMPAAFDDFADGFDAKFKMDDFKQPVHDYLGESGSLRLKGVKSAISLGSDNLTRRLAPPHGQAFGNRYDFGASLSAAISAANTALGDKSGLMMKAPPKKQSKKILPDAEETSSPLAMSSNQSMSKTAPPPKNLPAMASSSGTDSPRPAGTEKPILASQSYNELLDKYCFFGSAKPSPQLKDGTLRSGQYDGTNEDGYILGSVDSSANNSPVMMEKRSPPRTKVSTQASRSTSPAPMTGFVSGTSPMYHNLHAGFLHDAHAATAIRG